MVSCAAPCSDHKCRKNHKCRSVHKCRKVSSTNVALSTNVATPCPQMSLRPQMSQSASTNVAIVSHTNVTLFPMRPQMSQNHKCRKNHKQSQKSQMRRRSQRSRNMNCLKNHKCTQFSHLWPQKKHTCRKFTNVSNVAKRANVPRIINVAKS